MTTVQKVCVACDATFHGPESGEPRHCPMCRPKLGHLDEADAVVMVDVAHVWHASHLDTDGRLARLERRFRLQPLPHRAARIVWSSEPSADDVHRVSDHLVALGYRGEVDHRVFCARAVESPDGRGVRLEVAGPMTGARYSRPVEVEEPPL